jgi:hypothetical protein
LYLAVAAIFIAQNAPVPLYFGDFCVIGWATDRDWPHS